MTTKAARAATTEATMKEENEMPADMPPQWSIPPAQTFSFSNPQPSNMVIYCGTGNVTISLVDGKVTLTDCSNDEAALAFWKAVELFAPMKK